MAIKPLRLLVTALLIGNAFGQSARNCPDNRVSFELVTGYVYSAPSDLLDSQPGVLMLTDCINSCMQNRTCQSINYETGLCVLFGSSADEEPGALTVSQFPVFTIYVQKNCLGARPDGPVALPVISTTRGQSSIQTTVNTFFADATEEATEPITEDTSPQVRRRKKQGRSEMPSCDRAWSFERVLGYELRAAAKKTVRVASRQDCEEVCLRETDFECRSANFNTNTQECSTSDMDRHTMSGMGAFRVNDAIDYLENNCVDDPVKLCEFQKFDGRILKTVDSVFQDVPSLDECRQLCLSAPYRCHSFDFNDTGDNVCRLSHHAIATLTHIQEPFLEINGASTYELSSCYNVTIDCRSGDMVAKIKTSKVFNGKIYAKGNPTACVNDVTASLEFELRMGFRDLECGVRQDSPGRYSNDVILQHHDRIVTSADLGLSVHCQYDLGNKSVSNQVDLKIDGDITPALTEEAIVESPNVIMRVTTKIGDDTKSAQVGDQLDLRFEIMDLNSPYEIFVRDLVAMDGAGTSEILLIDDRGCPTDHLIMSPINKSPETPKHLVSEFEAFKFPTTDMVQFRALVTPCLPACEPVQCDIIDFIGEVRNVESYGRRKREVRERRSSQKEELLVVQQLRIFDKFVPDSQTDSFQYLDNNNSTALLNPAVFVRDQGNNYCVNMMGLVIAGALFLIAQVVIVGAFSYIWAKRKNSKHVESLSDFTTSSVAQLYDSGYVRRS
ncbi:uncharacterized protein LOC136037301 [Artemia franciscana]|uniref:Uncharacterized protein n=1 Tax=Artemia franciscana TaxID=6661 RepID=A0AA88L7D9_ARTSF|nr:hypothetical protein QYM36_005225 [Artemia franciscana]